jgi:hypothetical protein
MNKYLWYSGFLFLVLTLITGYYISHFPHNQIDTVVHVASALTALGCLGRAAWLWWRNRDSH